jgi:hypothetical protein
MVAWQRCGGIWPTKKRRPFQVLQCSACRAATMRASSTKLAVSEAPCSVEGCDGPAVARGWCMLHYNRWHYLSRRSGETVRAYTRPGQSKPVCAVEACQDQAIRKGWCHTHYKRWYRYGDPLASPRNQPQRCSVERCERPYHAKGWCHLHYERWWLHGDPLHVREDRLPRVCTVEGCERGVAGRGMCWAHYRRWLRHQDPSRGGSNPLATSRRGGGD